VKRAIGIALAVAAFAGGLSGSAYASPPDPDPNHHAVNAVCGNVPEQAQVPFCD
jgi:hypothetical protein